MEASQREPGLPLQVAPGVYVGLGYRTRATEVNEPLYFLMVHDRIESLL